MRGVSGPSCRSSARETRGPGREWLSRFRRPTAQRAAVLPACSTPAGAAASATFVVGRVAPGCGSCHTAASAGSLGPAAPRRAMAPPRRSGLRAGICATLLATASGLRLPSYVTDATAKLLAAAGERKADSAAAAAAGGAPRAASYPSELVEMPGNTRPELVKTPLPHTYVTPDAVPSQFSWGDVNGVSFLTRALNQHVPQCACPARARKAAPGGRGAPSRLRDETDRGFRRAAQTAAPAGRTPPPACWPTASRLHAADAAWTSASPSSGCSTAALVRRARATAARRPVPTTSSSATASSLLTPAWRTRPAAPTPPRASAATRRATTSARCARLCMHAR